MCTSLIISDILDIMKIATPSWGGDYVLFVLLLVLFEELGDEGGDLSGAATDAVVFAFDDGELGGGGVGGEVLLATPKGYETVVFAMEDEYGGEGGILLSAGDPSASSGITLRLLLKCDLFEVFFCLFVV